MALVFGRWCVAEELPWMGLRGAGWLEQAWTWWRPWPWACKRQAWRALKADGPSVWPVMFSGRVALDGLAGGEIGFGKACGSMVFGRWCLAEELPWMGLRGASLLEQAWTWWRPWPWQTRFHTSGGPRRRPCLGQGRGRRIVYCTLRSPITWDCRLLLLCPYGMPDSACQTQVHFLGPGRGRHEEHFMRKKGAWSSQMPVASICEHSSDMSHVSPVFHSTQWRLEDWM